MGNKDANKLCDCGSGKKYKRCCRKSEIILYNKDKRGTYRYGKEEYRARKMAKYIIDNAKHGKVAEIPEEDKKFLGIDETGLTTADLKDMIEGGELDNENVDG